MNNSLKDVFLFILLLTLLQMPPPYPLYSAPPPLHRIFFCAYGLCKDVSLLSLSFCAVFVLPRSEGSSFISLWYPTQSVCWLSSVDK